MTLTVRLRAQAPIPLDLAFEVGEGELLALVGPSGSGKTTTLRAIAGFWRPDAARIAVSGTPWLDTAQGLCLAPHRRRAGLVFQDFALFPHMTAAGNVAAAMGDLPARVRAQEAARLLHLVHLGDLGHRRPAELSGGQKQRVALARALARRPEVLLLDEPFSAVDRPTRDRLHEELIGLRAQLSMPVVLVTHDIGEAQLLADRMVVIDRGRIVADGSTATVMSDPAALRHLGLREIAAMLPARVAAQESDGMTRLDTAGGPIWLPRVDGAPGQRLRVRVLAHEVILSRQRPEGLSAQNILAGRVVSATPGEGPGVLVRIRVGDEQIVARITRRACEMLALAPGDPVFAILKTMSVARGHVAQEADSGGPPPR
ncbi:molybdenum ABC transporter ATP-binding protein [Maliponia aquimaris]|uniref:Sulfate/thiosulfate import ATP-binding protein CysA n=1 Tax=Maliponia aquimaris TaxID=1673631 RepID=A0A238K6V5_9RHOB|nr:molybdenum ABC transporter ATP-binding protein [Maliponia aquimaris]SMX38651.1 Sulfate/thiosulfate import ATP-binding protein CysA [Maliponia aquimaris]